MFKRLIGSAESSTQLLQSSNSERNFYRPLLFIGAFAYSLGWFFIEWSLPNSFNPISTRALTVFVMLAVALASSFSNAFYQKLPLYYPLVACLVTSHDFYQNTLNQPDINWIVGPYITIIACSSFIQSTFALTSYSLFVVALACLETYLRPVLLGSYFLPGIITVLFFINVGMYTRLRLLKKVRNIASRFYSFLDVTFDGIAVQEYGVVVEINESLARLLGYSVKEMLGKPLSSFFRSPRSSELLEALHRGTRPTVEVETITRNGNTLRLELAEIPCKLAGKSLTMTAMRDISSRKRAEEHRVLYQANQEALRIRDEFISIASHELKTPLTSIKIQSEMMVRRLRKLGREMPVEGEIQNFLEQISFQASRLARLIEDMLDISRISLGRFKMERSPVNVVDLLSKMVARLAKRGTTSKVSIYASTTGSSIVLGDKNRLEQVMNNLLTNALKYGNNKPVDIYIRAEAGELIVEFQDQGLGISRDDLERIFNRFERAISARHISGLGLGLFISRQIVEAHGGKIRVQSNLGTGSTFVIRLPLTREEIAGYHDKFPQHSVG
jgi:PAS domain S-box-containing protein